MPKGAYQMPKNADFISLGQTIFIFMALIFNHLQDKRKINLVKPIKTFYIWSMQTG